MNLFQIAWRNLQVRPAASLLTGASMALGVMLVCAVVTAYGVVGSYFDRNTSLSYSMVVGAKGDKLQLVLNSVFFLSQPVQNIPFDYYQEFLPKTHRYARQVEGKPVDGRFAVMVERVVPCCLGDTYEGYKVVGVPPELFDSPYAQGRKFEFAEGAPFTQEGYFTAVVGAEVARKTGLRKGSKFEPTHGGSSDGHKHDPFEVVGVLAPTGTPNDRALFVNIEGFYLLEGHDKSGRSRLKKAPAEHEHPHDHAHPHDHDHAHEPLPFDEREVTALWVQPKAAMFAMQLSRVIDKEPTAQAVAPIAEVTRFMTYFVSPTQWILLLLTGMVVLVSGISILVGFYNSLSERKHDVAVLRALGASRPTVMRLVLLESTILSLAGGAVGWVLGKLLFVVLNPLFVERLGVSVGLFDMVPLSVFAKQLGFRQWESLVYIPTDLLLVPALMLTAAAVGWLPAQAAYRTDVADQLK